MNVFDLISSVLGLTCVVLAGRGSKYNFWVGYLYTVALSLLFWRNQLYSNLMLQPISLCINVLGHYRWTHPKEGEQSSQKVGELKVSMLGWGQRVAAVIGVLVIGWLWGFLLGRVFPADPHPYMDSCVTVLILMAQFLSALKKWDCWIAWLFVNVTQLILHLSVGNIFMPIVSGLYLANGIVSLVNWSKMYKNKA